MPRSYCRRAVADSAALPFTDNAKPAAASSDIPPTVAPSPAESPVGAAEPARKKPAPPILPLEQVEELVLSHLGLAKAYDARAKCPGRGSRASIQGAAYLGLVQAARRFDPSRGFKFATIARRRIAGEILDEFRRVGPFPRRRHWKWEECPMVSALSDNDTAVGSRHSRESDPGTRAEATEEAEFLLAGLSEELRFVLWSVDAEGRTVAEVAKAIGKTEREAEKMLEAARVQVRNSAVGR